MEKAPKVVIPKSDFSNLEKANYDKFIEVLGELLIELHAEYSKKSDNESTKSVEK